MSPEARRWIDPARAAELYLLGLSLSQVAKVMGFSLTGVHLCLRRNGVPLRRQGVQGLPVDDEVLVQLQEQDVSGAEIARRLGMNVQTVYSRLRRRRLGL